MRQRTMLGIRPQEHFQKMQVSLGELCNSLEIRWILHL